MILPQFEKSVQEKAFSMKELHAHPYYEIYFLSSGERRFLLSNEIYVLTAPAMIIVPPHVMHMTQGAAHVRYNAYVLPSQLLDFERDIFDKLALKKIKLEPDRAGVIASVYERGSLFCARSYEKNKDEIIRGALSALAFSLADVQFDDVGVAKILPKDADIPRQYIDIVNYLSDNYKYKIALDDISKRFYITKTTLFNNFKKHFGCSPIDFLLNVRLSAAERLLLDTKLSVEEVAEACGFSSANYFSLIFKKKMHISPLNYRRQYL